MDIQKVSNVYIFDDFTRFYLDSFVSFAEKPLIFWILPRRWEDQIKLRWMMFDKISTEAISYTFLACK